MQVNDRVKVAERSWLTRHYVGKEGTIVEVREKDSCPFRVRLDGSDDLCRFSRDELELLGTS